MYPGDLSDDGSGAGDVPGGGRPAGGADTAGNAALPRPTAGTSSTSVGGAAASGAPACTPAPETCNGRDDDCNGAVDDLPADACPGGGFRYCVAGRLSECPRRCDVCVAGSVRICQNSFCSFWGEQECAADGQGFGHCREAKPPPECEAVAKKYEKSSQLERCCLDNGYCCVDEFDLDGDGNRGEMLGACADVSCQ